MTAWSTTARFDRALFARLADWLAVAVAAALPWSTTATGICIAAWLVALLPTLDVAAVRREVATAAGGLPVLLWCLGAIGMLWADVDWSARLGGLDGFNRLLMIPLLLVQFRRSEHGGRVICGFFTSAASVLVVSYAFVLIPGLSWQVRAPGIPVHDDIFQGAAFLICGFGAIGYAALISRSRHRSAALGIGVVGALFLANFGFVVFSRVTLAVAPVLAVMLGWRLFRWKGILAGSLAVAVLGGAFWFASPSVRLRLYDSVQEFREYQATNKGTSIGEHLAFSKESLTIIASAPILGHGTGAIAEQFRAVTAGSTGVSAEATVNPHNQTFAVAIQIGAVGALVLWSMWIAHFLLFRGEAVAAWLGTVVVVENVVSSTAHSHLFDFNNGLLYVLGVGVLGGMTQQKRAEFQTGPAAAKLA
jgi:O-antigen ligase